MGNSATRRVPRYECKSARKRNLRCDALDQHFESRGTGLHRLSLSKVWPRKKGRTRQTKSTTNCSLCWPSTAMVVNSAPASRRWRRQRPGQVCRNGLLAPAWNKMIHPSPPQPRKPDMPFQVYSINTPSSPRKREALRQALAQTHCTRVRTRPATRTHATAGSPKTGVTPYSHAEHTLPFSRRKQKKCKNKTTKKKPTNSRHTSALALKSGASKHTLGTPHAPRPRVEIKHRHKMEFGDR